MEAFTGTSDDALLTRALDVPLERLETPWLRSAGIELLVRRDDQVHPSQSGNKYYKLYDNLRCAHAAGYGRIASFGGPWSNHLHALAAAGADANIPTLGVVRGERPSSLSPTLADAEQMGMQLVFVSRQDYSSLQRAVASSGDSIQALWPHGDDPTDCYWVPEGGANLAGAAGMRRLGAAIKRQLDGQSCAAVCVACGTGTSLAGIAVGLEGELALGFSVLKGAGGLGADVQRMVGALGVSCQRSVSPRWRLISGFHGGGYARPHPPSLRRFWREFESQTGLLLDPVYTVKMFWAIHNLVGQGYWPRGARLVAVHTGGLQGRRGFPAP